MKLQKVLIENFKSIRSSGWFDIGDVTCLVGRNESGKTALLDALYRLNPVVESDSKFDVIDDYPRSEEEDYQQAVEKKERDPAYVVHARYRLETDELTALENEFGLGSVPEGVLTLWKGYTNSLHHYLKIDEEKACAFFAHKAKLIPSSGTTLTELSKLLKEIATAKAQRFASAQAAANAIQDVDERTKAQAEAQSQQESAEAKSVRDRLDQILSQGLQVFIYKTYLAKNVPKFLYFDEYYQMEGQVNIEQLKSRQANGTLLPSDRPMLGLIDLARLDLDRLLSADRTEALFNKMQGASNYLTKQVLKYWSQNRHLSIRFDIRPAKAGDPIGMQQGTNLWGLVDDTVHMATTRLGRRSKGFVWFFSFLAWFSQQKKRSDQLILLLDEPGMALHGTAQGDLLRYIEQELKPHHQVIYTTHSPFMVHPKHFDRVRIVEDKSIELEELPVEGAVPGTQVYTDVLEVTEGSLFPLQGALGYDISQSLFVGPYSLIVEGVSDLFYIQAISGILGEMGRTELSLKWTITPVGGADRVPTFAALLGAQKAITVATLIDIQQKDKQGIENLYKKKLLQKKHVLTFADFTATSEADIEDMFEPAFYLRLVNEEFKTSLTQPIELSSLPKRERILASINSYLQLHPLTDGQFNHYRPARRLINNIAELSKQINEDALSRFEKAFERLNAII